MKNPKQTQGELMIRLMTAALLLTTLGAPVRAQEAAPGTYSAGATARYVDLDFKGSRGLVQEYNGKLYYIGQGDVEVSNQGSRGLFDLRVDDIGSGEDG